MLGVVTTVAPDGNLNNEEGGDVEYDLRVTEFVPEFS
jgi:hypothetical protein